MRAIPMFTAVALAAAILPGCGGDDSSSAEKPATTTAETAQLASIKDYLLDHTAELTVQTGTLNEQAQQYYALAKAANFDHEKMLSENPEEVAELVTAMQATWRKANPAYEEMEGVVAGVPVARRLRRDHRRRRRQASDPENAVPFTVKYPGRHACFEQPGNFFFLIETSLCGHRGRSSPPRA